MSTMAEEKGGVIAAPARATVEQTPPGPITRKDEPYSIYTTTEKWFLVGMAAFAGLQR